MAGAIRIRSRLLNIRRELNNKGCYLRRTTLDSQELRDRVEEWIRSHMDTNKLEESRATEEREQELLAGLKL